MFRLVRCCRFLKKLFIRLNFSLGFIERCLGESGYHKGFTMTSVYIVLSILLIVSAFAILKKTYWLIHDTSHPPRSNSELPENMPFRYRLFCFRSSRKLTLQAIEYIPNQPPKGTVLAFHYLGGSKTAIYPYIEGLLKAGFTIVSFDYPNHGESEAQRRNRYTLEDDMKLFLKEVQKRGIQGPYGTFGFSMGATLAFSAADCLPELKAIAIDSGPLIYVKDYFQYVLRNKNIKNKLTRIVFLFFYLHIIGFYRMSRRMVKRLKRLRGLPVLMFHSKKDNIISYKNAVYAYDQIKSDRVEFISVDRSHHMTNRVLLGKAYDEKVREFFKKWLVENEER